MVVGRREVSQRAAAVMAALAVGALATGCAGKAPLGERLVQECGGGKVYGYGNMGALVVDDTANPRIAFCYLEKTGFGKATGEKVIATRPWDGEQSDTLGIADTFKATWRIGDNGKMWMRVEQMK